MTIRELWPIYRAELDRVDMRNIDGINSNATKRDLENAIACLRANDEEMQRYLDALRNVYPNTAATIAENGDYKKHYFNRMYVFNIGRQILKGDY